MYIVPTYFTAIDKYSQPLGMMGKATEAFNAKVAMATTKLLAYGEAAALLGGVALSGKAVMDYETELQNLKALTGVTGKEFIQFKETIAQVAQETRKSSVETAQAFTTIANAMPELLQSAEGLGTVTRASIELAKAARIELTPAAESVTTILNQFGKGAETAAGLVDMMAAGSKYGSAEISDLAASMTEFGAQARLAGLSLQESIGVTELVSKFRKGAEAGTQLRNVLTEMSKGMASDPKAIADMQRYGVNIALVADKTKPIIERFKELSKVAGDSNALFHIFGKENSAMAYTVLQNSGKLAELTTNIGETGNAARMAAENSNTLANRLLELKNSFITTITTSNGASFSLGLLKNVVVFITDHMEGLVTIASLFIGRLVLLKTITIATTAAQYALGFAEGFVAVMTGNLSKMFVINASASKGAAAGIWLVDAATWALNLGAAALITTVTLGAGALFLIAGAASLATENMDDMTKNLEKSKDGFTDIVKPISDAQIALAGYNDQMKQYNDEKIRLNNQEIRFASGHYAAYAASAFGAFITGSSDINSMDQPDIHTYMTDSQIQETQKDGTATNTNTNNNNQNIQLHITSDAGSNVQVMKNTGGTPIKISPTGGSSW